MSQGTSASTSNVQGHKRKRLNFEGQDYQGPKRQRVPLNKKLRQSVVCGILFAHIRVVQNLNGASMLDLSLSEQITAALLNAHNCERQKLNAKGGLASKVKDVTFHFYNNEGEKVQGEVSKDLVAKILRDCLSLYGLKYEKQNEWIGIASPMFAFMTGFKARRQELRIGTSDLPISKATAGGTTTLSTIPVAEYGLTQAHGVLLEGITYQPALKSMMAQSLGPMTSLIMLSRSGNGMYSNKWEEAALRDLMNLPDISQAVQLIKSNPASQTKPLLRLIADILLITGSRSANRMFLPAFCLIHALLDRTTIEEFKKVKESPTGYGALVLPVLTWQDELSFSGAFAFEMYQKVADLQWALSGPRSCTDVAMMKQVFFHTVFGTYKEDLGVLSWMVEGNPKFLNRKALTPAFGKAEQPITFKPYKLIRWSKMASAQQTDFLGSSASQVAVQSAFSGFRMRNWGEDFFKHLESDGIVGGYSATRNLQGMIGQYSALLNKLRSTLEKRDKKTFVGTVSWFTFLKANGVYIPEAECPVENGLFFIDNRD